METFVLFSCYKNSMQIMLWLDFSTKALIMKINGVTPIENNLRDVISFKIEIFIYFLMYAKRHSNWMVYYSYIFLLFYYFVVYIYYLFNVSFLCDCNLYQIENLEKKFFIFIIILFSSIEIFNYARISTSGWPLVHLIIL